MSDVYIPGIKSRFNSEKIIEDLMKLERVPRDRAESTIERYETEKGYWQDLGRRLTSLRDSARQLFSYQNPFSERIVSSGDESVIMGSARRDTAEQERTFTVKQIAQADRFLSTPLEDSYKVESGTYTFSVGKENISFEFRGGTLREFTTALNRRGRDLIQSNLVAVKPGTQSLLIESKVTGEENRLVFSDAAAALGEKTGMIGRVNDSGRSFSGETIKVAAGETSRIPVNFEIPALENRVLKFETSTEIKPETPAPDMLPPAGPSIPATGSVSYGGIVVENDSTTVELPPWTPPEPPKRVDNMGVLSLAFSDGSVTELPPISDSPGFNPHQYNLNELAPGKTIVSLTLTNDNTHRDVNIRNVQILDPNALGGAKPLNAVSVAQDAVISMEGIEIHRPGNEIDDLIPGVSVSVLGTSDRPVRLKIEPDREAIKDSIIGMVGNYNRLMADINVLTRTDNRVIEELSYLSDDEKTEYHKRLGTFSGDSTLMQMRGSLIRIITSPYPTSEEQDLAMLAQIGVGSDVRRAGATTGFDASRLRGYLEIDEKELDMAISTKLAAIKELFSSDSTGDMLPDTGIAFSIDALAKPYAETGGFITVKTGNIDSRIDQERRRIDTIDRQLVSKEATLRKQYGQMEGAYNRMEQMSTSLDRFQQQNSGGR